MPYAASAVEGGLTILETLGTAHQLGMTRLVKKLGLHKSSAYWLITASDPLGYVQRNPRDDRYQLTYRPVAVGSRAADRMGG